MKQNRPMHVVPGHAQRSMGGLGPTAAADVLPADNHIRCHPLPVGHRRSRIGPETGATYRELIFLSCAIQGTTGQRQPAEVQRDVLPGIRRPLAPSPRPSPIVIRLRTALARATHCETPQSSVINANIMLLNVRTQGHVAFSRGPAVQVCSCCCS